MQIFRSCPIRHQHVSDRLRSAFLSSDASAFQRPHPGQSSHPSSAMPDLHERSSSNDDLGIELQSKKDLPSPSSPIDGDDAVSSAATPHAHKSKGVRGMELLRSRLTPKFLALLYGAFTLSAYVQSLGLSSSGSPSSVTSRLKPVPAADGYTTPTYIAQATSYVYMSTADSSLSLTSWFQSQRLLQGAFHARHGQRSESGVRGVSPTRIKCWETHGSAEYGPRVHSVSQPPIAKVADAFGRVQACESASLVYRATCF